MTVDYVELEALMYDHHLVLLITAYMGQTDTGHNDGYQHTFDEAYELAKIAMAKLRSASD